MPVVTHRLELPISLSDAFAHWRFAANRILWTPAEYRLQQVDGPAEASQGVRWKWKMRRWGMTQHLESEVTVCDPPTRYEEVQRQGPLPRWMHRLRFLPRDAGTLLEEEIDFDPPGGMLGLWLTAGRVIEEIEAGWAFRDEGWLRTIGTP